MLFYIGQADKTLFQINKGANKLKVKTDSTITDTNFHCMIVTHDGTRTVAGTKIYINGVSQSLETINDCRCPLMGNFH